MIEAWLSASEMITSWSVRKLPKSPPFRCVQHQKGQKEHPLVAALQILQEFFRFTAVGSKVRWNDAVSYTHLNAQRSQLLTVMADAVSECRTAADQAAELNETGQVGLLRLAEVWSAIRAKEGMGLSLIHISRSS